MLADDFTGAGDVALGFGEMGLAAQVTILRPGSPATRPGRGVRVWILDTESRFLAPALARGRVRQALRALRGWKADFIFKKVDSALRGPVAAELAAFCRGVRLGPSERLAFVPAFPRMGRTTVRGTQFVFGRRLDRSIFARDPRNPVRSSFLPQIVGKAVASRLWIPDMRNENDMSRAAACLGRTSEIFPAAAAGSAGWAEALARQWSWRFRRPVPVLRPRPGPAAGVMAVVGSMNPRSRRQLAVLKHALAAPKERARVRAGLARERVVVLQTPSQRGSPRRAMHDLLRQVGPLARRRGIQRFVATGGETAYALCRLWRQFQWRLVGKIDTGVPVCAPVSTGGPARYLVTKPGGFGGDRSLILCVRVLQRLKK